MKAIEIEAFGNPADVVKAVDVADVGAPAAGEVVIALEASPAKHYSSREVFVRHLQKMTSTTRKEN